MSTEPPISHLPLIRREDTYLGHRRIVTWRETDHKCYHGRSVYELEVEVSERGIIVSGESVPMTNVRPLIQALEAAREEYRAMTERERS